MLGLTVRTSADRRNGDKRRIREVLRIQPTIPDGEPRAFQGMPTSSVDRLINVSDAFTAEASAERQLMSDGPID